MLSRSIYVSGASLLIAIQGGVAHAHAQTTAGKPADNELKASAPTAGPADETTAAQAGPPNASDQADIIVTGSRIERGGFASPTPVTTVSQDKLTTAAPIAIADGLNQLPQFRSSNRPEQAVTTANGSAGANQLNLRNLGVNRNLVLVDGRRVVGSNINVAVDINLLPEALIRRVDVVTGGASAAYGSDAVAGVVNFIIDDRFKGLKGVVQGGMTDIGDSESFKANLAVGGDLSDNLRIIASVDYSKRNGIGIYDFDRRDWSSRSTGLLTNAAGVLPTRIVGKDNVFLNGMTAGGLITAGPLAGTAFGAPGQTTPFQYGTFRSGLFMLGGVGGQAYRGGQTAGTERGTGFVRAVYAVPGGPEISLEVNAGRTVATQEQLVNNNFLANGFTIFADNPFIPADILSRMQTAKVASIPLARLHTDLPSAAFQNRTDVVRGVLAVKGEAAGGKYGVYFSHGYSDTRVKNYNVNNYNRIFAAVDAVRDPVTGTIVCRSTLLSGRNPGCVPFNPFGVGAPSQAAIAYVQGTEIRDLHSKQDVGSIDFQRPLFSLWAEPVVIALGGEWRRETLRQDVNTAVLEVIDFTGVRGGPAGLVGQVGPFLYGNPKPIGQHSVTVREAFVEIDAPIVSDQPFADLLAVNGAARITDYSTSGSVKTWKVGAVYKPFNDLRLRVTQSRDIRAPNLVDLFTGAVNSQAAVAINGMTYSTINTTAGNPNLLPEKANTLTYGGVYEPSWAKGLSISVDRYSIDIAGAIASLTAQQLVNACAAGSTAACANIVPSGTTFRLALNPLNLNALKTTGWDIEAAYRMPVGAGHLTLAASGNYQGMYRIATPGAPVVDLAGEIGQNQSLASPKWLGTASATYQTEALKLFGQVRFISAGKYGAAYVEGRDIDDNHIPSVAYVDASASYAFDIGSHRIEPFVTINNLFNKEPPIVPVLNVPFNTNPSLYDTIGRYITIGAKFVF